MKEDLLWRGKMQACGVFWRLVVMAAIRKHLVSTIRSDWRNVLIGRFGGAGSEREWTA